MNTVKHIYAGNPDKPLPWIFIPDTTEARTNAIAQGYSAFSTMSFDYEPEKSKPEPTRYGSLWLDIDCKGNPAKAVELARRAVFFFAARYGVELRSFRYFLSGGKGVHLEIPAAVFGGTAGHPHLPMIHKTMLAWALKLGLAAIDHSVIDTSLYCGGRGKLLRAPNIQRPDGNYKVQLSYDEFMDDNIPALLKLVKSPRDATHISVAAPQKSAMSLLFDASEALITMRMNGSQRKAALDAVMDCEFIQHCYQNQATLSEPEWFRMVGILMSFGETARPIVHEFSMGYPGYSYDETEKKIACSRSDERRITCDFIREVYPCQRQCRVHAPASMLWKHKANHEIATSSFRIKEDGVYYSAPDSQDGDGMRLCSPMKIMGKMRNPDGVGWARLVEFTAPDGQLKRLCINMRDCTGRGDTVRALLSDHGLEISMHSKVNCLLMEYIQYGGPDDTIFLQMEKVGWHSGTYILPDAQFGNQLTERIYFEAPTDSLHSVKGTLDDWRLHVGKFCQGNSLLVLAVSYALCGPLLRPCELEGGGLHIYGASSTGKTTCALVAGSVCGGGGNRGYLRQWRSTHNALEHTAAMHNDNLLVLDEVGQATAEVVSQVAYMLPNGQGRERMRADASRRAALTWRLNFFSTGELTINDKIEENGKLRAMAGQVVRIIDLPVDSGSGKNLFANLHGQAGSASLSNALVEAAVTWYGAPFRAFLEAFCAAIEVNTAHLLEKIDAFVNSNVPAGATGQVKRVARKFGLMAAAGEAAISWGIFPFSPGEANAAAREWFGLWLEQRGGHGDVEMARVLKRIQDHFAVEHSRYIPVDNMNWNPSLGFFGYTRMRNNLRQYLMLSVKFEEITRGVNRTLLLEVLREQKWVVLSDTGKVRETHSVKGENKRGIVFIPSVWEGKPDSARNIF